MKYLSLLIVSGSLWITPALSADYEALIPEFESLVDREMRDWNISGVSVAFVDDQEIVYSQGFGDATRESIFRAGSISKLFNALAVLQQVEAGSLDLDAPIPEETLPINPFRDQPAITLRHMLSHRSGLQREAPIGGYLDDSEAGIRATVESIRPSVLVTRPGEKTRYSNIAPTFAGHLVERATGESFEDYQEARLLSPLGMENSSWTLANTPADRVITSYMRVADGQGGWTRRECPLFDLGTIPAGNLFTTAEDLALFASALIRVDGALVKFETLELMWTPQYTEGSTGFGLGFVVGDFHGYRTIGHNGAVYGHSSAFIVAPEQKVAVVVMGNEDIANGRIGSLQKAGLALMLNAKVDANIQSNEEEYVVEDLSRFVGDYESESYWARIEVREGRLVGDVSGQPLRLRASAPETFAADSRIHDSATLRFEMGEDGTALGFSLSGQHYQRVEEDPTPLPDAWRAVLGAYGSDFIPVIVTERHGHLYAMTENMVDYRLTPINRHVCGLPPGMYIDEEVVFLTNENGRMYAMNFANMILQRRD